MKIKKSFMLREVAGTYVAVPMGESLNEFKGMINLNECSAMLFKKLQNGATFSELLEDMTDTYEVEKNIAEADLTAFINGLRESGLIEE